MTLLFLFNVEKRDIFFFTPQIFLMLGFNATAKKCPSGMCYTQQHLFKKQTKTHTNASTNKSYAHSIINQSIINCAGWLLLSQSCQILCSSDMRSNGTASESLIQLSLSRSVRLAPFWMASGGSTCRTKYVSPPSQVQAGLYKLSSPLPQK